MLGEKSRFKVKQRTVAHQLEPYEYDELGDSQYLRLLKVQDDNDEALSYSWEINAGDFSYIQDLGDEKQSFVEHVRGTKHTTICNGKAFLVTQNLYEALLQLRRMRRSSFIWIDAICINQTDLAEKTRQVALMTRIYSSASTVIIWLGPQRGVPARILRMIRALPDCSNDDCKGLLCEDCTLYADMIRLLKYRCFGGFLFQHLSFTFLFSAVENLASRSWFSRTWVVQEVVVARELIVVCGKHELPLNNLYRFLSFRSGLWFQSLRNRTTLKDIIMARQLYKQEGAFGLEQGLLMGRFRNASDPRDKVFAWVLLSQSVHNPTSVHTIPTRDAIPNAHESVTNLFAVDYEKRTTTVYRDCANWLLHSSTGLETLSMANAGNSSSLPSWVPDWRSEPFPRPFHSYLKGCFAASPCQQGPLTCRIQGRSLFLQCFVLDKVCETSCWGGIYFLPLQQLAGSFLPVVTGLGQMYDFTHEPTLTALWRTIVANMGSESYPAPHSWDAIFRTCLVMFISFADYFLFGDYGSYSPVVRKLRYCSPQEWKVWRETFLIVHDSPTYPLRKDSMRIKARLSSMWKFWKGKAEPLFLAQFDDREVDDLVKDRFLDFSQGRILFTTQKGYLGNGNATVEKGDVIALVAGAKVPHIFRLITPEEKDQTVSKYHLIGETYVHGVMNGQVRVDSSALEEMEIL